jgi:uncharacterized protein (UPF0335 family)
MTETPKDKPDLTIIFDISRTKTVTSYVERFEELIRSRKEISDEIAQLSEDAKNDHFTPVEVGAMKDVAKWRVSDKTIDAAHKLAALRRVSNAVKLDLFEWADQQKAA